MGNVTKKISTTIAIAVGVLLLTFNSAANAHHSFAIFAIEHKIALSGVLTEARFVNPHIMMKFETTDENGDAEEWTIESMQPARFDSLGGDRDFIKVGDSAVFYGFPARNCDNFIALSAIEMEKGTMVVTEEIRQGSAIAAVPDETDMCDSWPK